MLKSSKESDRPTSLNGRSKPRPAGLPSIALAMLGNGSDAAEPPPAAVPAAPQLQQAMPAMTAAPVVASAALASPVSPLPAPRAHPPESPAKLPDAAPAIAPQPMAAAIAVASAGLTQTAPPASAVIEFASSAPAVAPPSAIAPATILIATAAETPATTAAAPDSGEPPVHASADPTPPRQTTASILAALNFSATRAAPVPTVPVQTADALAQQVMPPHPAAMPVNVNEDLPLDDAQRLYLQALAEYVGVTPGKKASRATQ